MPLRVTQVSLTALIQPDDSLTETEVSNFWLEVLADAPAEGNVHFHATRFSHSVSGDANVVIDPGDRAVYDTTSNAALHAADIQAGLPQYHAPWPASSGAAPVSDGSKYVATDIATQAELDAHTALTNPHQTSFLHLVDTPGAHVATNIPVVNAAGNALVFEPKPDRTIMTIGTKEGALDVVTSPFRIYNRYAGTRVISEVFISVSNAPDASVIVDILKNGSSIFSAQGNMPTIAASGFTGSSTTIQSPNWAQGEYLQFDILQVGTTLKGENLTVHIVSVPGAYA